MKDSTKDGQARRASSSRRKSPAKPRAASLDALRQEHIGRLLLIGSRIFERLALTELSRLGFGDLRLAHLVLIRTLPVEGIRTSEAAEYARMTKQAVGQLAIELEKAGYVVRLPDPTDGRAKIVRFATRGQTLIAALPQVLMNAEAQIEAMIGAQEFMMLRRSLKTLALHAAAADSPLV